VIRVIAERYPHNRANRKQARLGWLFDRDYPRWSIAIFERGPGILGWLAKPSRAMCRPAITANAYQPAAPWNLGTGEPKDCPLVEPPSSGHLQVGEDIVDPRPELELCAAAVSEGIGHGDGGVIVRRCS